ncbi:hypothetical protein D3C76_1795070 [compost metagenome]
MAASSSLNFRCFGLLVMSAAVAIMLPGSLSVISPCLAISSSARPELVGSLGIATMAPSCNSATDLTLLE